MHRLFGKAKPKVEGPTLGDYLIIILPSQPVGFLQLLTTLISREKSCFKMIINRLVIFLDAAVLIVEVIDALILATTNLLCFTT